jgi:hypothetical protein
MTPRSLPERILRFAASGAMPAKAPSRSLHGWSHRTALSEAFLRPPSRQLHKQLSLSYGHTPRVTINPAEPDPLR